MADDLSGMKLGKLQAKHLKGLPTFGRYATTVPTAPPAVMYSDKLRHLGQMANDQLGDCLSAETLVLTADLRWVEIGSVKIGDELVGFDEQATVRQGRCLRTSVVEHVKVMMKPCFDLVFEDGTKIRASFDHQWLRRWRGGVGRKQAPSMWLRTDRMRAHGKRPTRLAKCFEPWVTEDSYEAGYLAAALDGEGCYSRASNGTAKMVQFSQSKNEMLEAVGGLLKERDFNVAHLRQMYSSLSTKGYDVLRVGNKQQVARLLGTIRPKRLLPKFRPEHLGYMESDKIALVEKIDVGVQQVIAVQTSTHTFIAEGFASHNCTCAAVGHAIQLWTSRTQPAEVVLSDNQIVDFYVKTCGYVRGDPLSDNGGVASDVLAAWYKAPLDGHGLAGFANIRPGNRADIRAAIWLFGVCYIGVQLPLAAQSGVWDIDPDKKLTGDFAPGSWGGHAIPIVDYDVDSTTCITWGGLKPMSWNWLDTYCDEAYALLSRDWLDQAGHSPSNFDFAALQADMLAIRQ